ncbi:uncharacterized protein LOC141601332 [Silene latifolia]|uniref:uncharacterized protein LOC141601332 n=1 Tax=Silene latifolia TaxID=37657 RepID=UPI003D777C77
MAFLHYYKNLLGSRNPTERIRSAILNQGPCCTQEQAASLMLPITNEEIKGIFFSTPIDKSLGLDGYTSGFFKDAWDVVGPDVCEAIKDFFSTDKLLTQVNATNITLIPKCERLTSVKPFRPTACCNMIYKVISKLLCNRLFVILPDIVHENQGAFIKERSIMENILICQDIMKLYNRAAVSPRFLFKIDLQKAYDTMEWDFVENLLLGLKFRALFYDLLLFYKGNPQSVMLLLRAFSTFSKASGLSMNNSKSEWSNIFILPKSVIRRLEAICQNYLWDGTAEFHRVPLVGWDTVTLPNIEGGLGIKKAEVSNVAIGAKLVDWIYYKADRLWIRWINQVYIKQHDWHSYSPPADAAWTWKSIFRVKELMKDAYTDGQWQLDLKGYTVRSGYDWLRSHQIKPWWYNTIQNSWIVHKQAIITWLIMHNGMNTREKLYMFGCCNSDACCICGNATETQPYLFFECDYSKAVISLIQDLCGACISLSGVMTGGYGNGGGKLKQQVYTIILNPCTYHIWAQRNSARINGILMVLSLVVQKIIEVVRQRIKFKCNAKVRRREEDWLDRLRIRL